MDLRVISIGVLAAHPLWDERSPVRTGHATTTLIRSGDATILVDPGLPGPILQARLAERANLKPADITHVFLTSFRPDTTRGLDAFPEAVWWISEAEREGVGVPLAQTLRQASDQGDAEIVKALERDIGLLQRCRPAPDNLAPHVDLFPLPGVTPGLCGLLVSEPGHTILVAGDAVPTAEHMERGMVLPQCASLEKARESLLEAVEIADLLVLGRDNVVVNRGRRPF
ncbi:MAG: MBL fold metallo-hydrolase [Phycisphaeraceae bacterium]|nr:MAG: MBL fold metallo-hydrolase [Phycisphaeraceae bacterium]